MSRRILLTSAIVALFFGLLFLAPGIPAVRQALLQQVVTALSDVGVELSYDSSEGNALRRIELTGARLSGYDAELRIQSLDLAYHLPSLLGGELPLDLTARGVHANLDLTDIEQLVAQLAGSPSTGILSRIRVLPRHIDLQDVTFDIANAPYKLPDASIRNVSVQPVAGALLLGATVATDAGEIVADGRLALPTLDLTGNIIRADVAVARQWWPGAISGSVSGPYSLRRGQFNADLQLANGSIHQSGFDVTDITGTVTMRYPHIEAEVSGFGLGGPVSATGLIDVMAMHYDIEGNAAPQLANVADWLTNFYGFSQLPIDATGTASARATVTGWKTPRVQGTATAGGSVAGLPLSNLSATLDLVTKGAMRLAANGEVGGGPVAVNIVPGSQGNTLQVNGTDISLQGLVVSGFAPGGTATQVRANVGLTGGLDGTMELAWQGMLDQYQTELQLDGQINRDGLQLFASASASSEAAEPITATGAVVYANGQIDAGVTVADLAVPGLVGPVRVGITAQGQADLLEVAATLEGDEPVTLDVKVLQPGGAMYASDVIDLRGRATATFAQGTLQNVRGTFGPLQLSGGVQVSPLTADLSVTSDVVTVRAGSRSVASDAVAAVLNGTDAEEGASMQTGTSTATAVGAAVAVQAGRLLYSDQNLSLRAQAVVAEAKAGNAVTVDVNTVDVAFDYTIGTPPATGEDSQPNEDQLVEAATGPAQTAEAATAPGQTAASAWSITVQTPQQTARFYMDSTGAPYELVATDLPVFVGNATRPALVTASLAPGQEDTLDLRASIAPESQVAGLNIVNGALFTGRIEPSQQRLVLRGAVGSLPATTEVGWSDATVMVTALTGSAAATGTQVNGASVPGADLELDGATGLVVSYAPATEEWSLAGTDSLGPLLAELGVTAVNPHFSGQLSYTTVAGYGGTASLALSQPVDVTVDLVGNGSELAVHLASQLGGVPIEGSGAIDRSLIQALSAALSVDQSGSVVLLLDVGPFTNISLSAHGLHGAGQTDSFEFGPVAIEPVPWSLDFSWRSSSGFVETGGSALNLALQDGRIEVEGSLAAPVQYAGRHYLLRAWPGDQPGELTTVSSVEDLRLGATLTPADGSGPIASVSGPIDALVIQIDVTLQELAAALPPEYQPTGTLTASATLNVLGGPSYEGQLTLQPEPSGQAAQDHDVHATFSGSGGDFTMNVQGSGLSVTRTPPTALTDGRLTLSSYSTDLGRFFPVGVGVVLDGELSYGAAGWRGRLDVGAQADSLGSVDASLVGEFSQLNLQLTGTGVAGSSVQAAGSLLPNQDITGTYDLFGGQLFGQIEWSDSLTATAATKEVLIGDWLTVPPLNAAATVDLVTGTVAVFTPNLAEPGAQAARSLPYININMVGGALSGTLEVPALVQATQVVLAAEVGGTLTNPSATATLRTHDDGSGGTTFAALSGSLLEGVALQAEMTSDELASLLPAAIAPALDYAGGPIEVHAYIDSKGEWQLLAVAPLAAALSTPTNQLGLQLQATGHGASYQGGLAFTNRENGTTGTIAVANIAGSGASAKASLDLATIDWILLGHSLGVALEVQGDGLLSVGTGPLSADLTLDLAGMVAEHTVRLRGTAPDDLSLSVDGQTVQLTGQLDWSPNPAGGGSAHLSGSLLGRPFRADLNVDAGLGAGSLEVLAAGATVTATMTTSALAGTGSATRSFVINADVPSGTWADIGGAGFAHVTAGESGWHVQQLETRIDGLLPPLQADQEVAAQPPGTAATDSATPNPSADAEAANNHERYVTLRLAGPVAPNFSLSGTLSTPRLAEPAHVALHANGGGLTLNNLVARFEWHDLTATITNPPANTSGGPLDALVYSLSGSADADDLAQLMALSGNGSAVAAQLGALDAGVGPVNLSWSASGGWQGNLKGQANAPWATGSQPFGLVASAENGSLRVLARSRSASDLVELSVLVPPDPFGSSTIEGALQVLLSTEQVVPGIWVPATLRGDISVSGTLLSPSLSGPFRVAGAVEALGTVQYSNNIGDVQVYGDGLFAVLQFNSEGTFASLQLDELPLDAWLPQMDSAKLSLEARLANDTVTVSDLRLTGPNSLVTGGASLRLGALDDPATTRFNAALDTNLNLADLNLGNVELLGSVRGPALISASSLTDLSTANIIANLAALRVHTPALEWTVSGNLTLGGTLGNPSVGAEFYGDGDLNGNLNIYALPAVRAYELSSTLSLGQLATNLRVELGDGVASASGTARYGDGVFAVGNRLGPGGLPELTVTGAGQFAGLSALIAGDLSSITLGGSLESLSQGLTGHMHVTVDAHARNWLAGSITGVNVGGRVLAPIDISATTPGATIVVQSTELRAAVDPTTLAWNLSVSALQLGQSATAPLLTVWATGTGANASMNASLRADDYEVAAELRHDQNTALLLEGTAFGGELLITAARNAGSREWTGGGYFEGAQLAGFAVDAQATVLGVGLLPHVVLATTARNGVTVEGNASVGTDGITIDQLVRGGPLQQALRVQGRLLPTNDLTLSTIELEPGAPLTAASAERATTSSVRVTGGLARTLSPDNLRATGRLQVDIGPAHIELFGVGSTPQLEVALAALPRLRARTNLPANDLLDLVSEVMNRGLTLNGVDAARGQVTVRPNGLSLQLNGFGAELSGVDLEATGTISESSADVTGVLNVRTDLPVAERQTGYVFPWQLTAANRVWRLHSSGTHGVLQATYSAAEGQLALSTDLYMSEGRVTGNLGLQESGLTGELVISDVTLFSPELGALTIALDAVVTDGLATLTSSVASSAGRVAVDGTWGLGGLLPSSIVGDAPASSRLEARVRSLELSDIPYVAEQLPEVSGELNGLVQVRDGFVLGQFVSQQISVADITTPLQLNVSGRPSDLALDLQLRGAIGRADLQNGNLAGILRFERFPLTLISTAAVGPSDFSADVTGVMRFDGPLSAPLQGYLRVATEEVRLERMGVTTLGNVTITLEDGEVTVDRAEFEGLGAWSAKGVLRTNLFDFTLQANEADFTPLLGLVPAFARLGVEAVGSFDLSVKGNAAEPSVSLTSPDLEVQVSGTRYRLSDTALGLSGVELSVASRVTGLRPVTGTLDVNGTGLLSLFPFSLANTDLTVAGSATLGTFGTLTGVTGQLIQLADGTPAVNVTGTLGQRPLVIEGTLSPLDLHASGTGVTLSMPGLLIDRAVVDADVGLVAVPGGVSLSGTIVADEVIVDPSVRNRAAQQPAAEPGTGTAASTPAGTTAGGTAGNTVPATVEDESGVEPGQATQAADQGNAETQPQEGTLPDVEAITVPEPAPQRQGGLDALHFDNLIIRAPGRVTLTTNVGSFEAGLDLTLAGTGADPRLSGMANAIRGNLRFGGRDFNIARATATFTPNRGVYPELDVVATSEFDKQRVLATAPNVSFIAPREGSTFEVQLAFIGPVEPSEAGGFRFDVNPVLTSNALIEVQGETMGISASRPFTETELMSLITLGRFELNADFVGAGGLGEAVATGVIDTAIDLLVVSGLEGALREALGLDVVEIRTSSLTSLLDESSQPFGVSLRLGGYINPELFASYRISTYDGADPDFSVTNEVLLRYALGPLDLDFIARVDLPTAGSQGQPRPEIGVMLGYQFSPSFSVDGGVTIGFSRTKLEFGVTIRW